MSAPLFPIAHAGHWINGGLYLLPVVVIGLLLWIQARRDKRLGDDDDGDYEEPDDDVAAP